MLHVTHVAYGSYVSCVAYMRKERSDKGKIQITERDIAVLTWIGEQYAVRFDLLQRLLGRDTRQETAIPGLVGEGGVNRIINRWTQDGLVESHKFLHRQPPWIWLTGRGLTHIGLNFKVWSPSISTLAHRHNINLVRFKVEAQFGENAQWRGERLLYKLYQKSQTFHMPDGEIIYEKEKIGIEIELTQKNAQRIQGIVKQLSNQYDGVWYFVNETTRPVVGAAMAKTGVDQEMFRLFDIADVHKF